MNNTDRIIKSQFAYISRKWGKKAADAANYGWVTDGHGKNFSITTKVYNMGGKPRKTMLVLSQINNNRVSHYTEPY